MKLSQTLAFEKLKRYCSYQDRCHQEVRTKLISLKIYGHDLEEVITELIKEDFLNEARFACSYARGKFRIKKWGRNKIKQQLQQRQVSSYCITQGMKEIDEEEYLHVLEELIKKQLTKHQELPEYIRKDKTIKYANGRGYEANLIFQVIRELELNNAI